MKTFRYQYSITGPNGTFSGEVRISLNHSRKSVYGILPVTDYLTTIPYHLIESFIEKHLWNKSETPNDHDLLETAQLFQTELEHRLHHLAHQKPKSVLESKLNDLGFRQTKSNPPSDIDLSKRINP